MNQPEPELHPTTELAALYVAGALSPDERRDFEQRLAGGDPEAVAALRSLDPVMDALIGALPPLPPPPRIRTALLQQITMIRPGDPEPPARSPLVIHRAFDSIWEDTPMPGVRQRVLHRDPQRRQVTLLIRMAAGATIPAHCHDGPEESLILEGDLHVGHHVLGEGDYQFAPAGSFHEPLHSENGCLALLIVPMRPEDGADQP